ncbi:hypothetical protein AAVH_13537 [Aphelenchoides avenae]|nr:hypothetical protein AAVH_13537 [Aphelenchus avenae]
MPARARATPARKFFRPNSKQTHKPVAVRLDMGILYGESEEPTPQAAPAKRPKSHKKAAQADKQSIEEQVADAVVRAKKLAGKQQSDEIRKWSAPAASPFIYSVIQRQAAMCVAIHDKQKSSDEDVPSDLPPYIVVHQKAARADHLHPSDEPRPLLMQYDTILVQEVEQRHGAIPQDPMCPISNYIVDGKIQAAAMTKRVVRSPSSRKQVSLVAGIVVAVKAADEASPPVIRVTCRHFEKSVHVPLSALYNFEGNARVGDKVEVWLRKAPKDAYISEDNSYVLPVDCMSISGEERLVDRRDFIIGAVKPWKRTSMQDLKTPFRGCANYEEIIARAAFYEDFLLAAAARAHEEAVFEIEKASFRAVVQTTGQGLTVSTALKDHDHYRHLMRSWKKDTVFHIGCDDDELPIGQGIVLTVQGCEKSRQVTLTIRAENDDSSAPDIVIGSKLHRALLGEFTITVAQDSSRTPFSPPLRVFHNKLMSTAIKKKKPNAEAIIKLLGATDGEPPCEAKLDYAAEGNGLNERQFKALCRALSDEPVTLQLAPPGMAHQH